MTPRLPHADELGSLPLTDEAAVLERVAALVRCATRRQLWFLPLDAGRRQLPLVVPVEVPRRPDDDAGRVLAGLVAALGTVAKVAEVVVVIERPGPEVTTIDDLAWLAALGEARELVDVPIVGPMLAHDAGVRWAPGSHRDAGDDPASPRGES